MITVPGPGELFPPRGARRPRFVADVTVDGHRMGTLASPQEITPAMRAHGITASDLKPVLAGRRRVRQFVCGGAVRIVGRLRVPPSDMPHLVD